MPDFRDLSILGAELVLLVIYCVAGTMKLLYPLGLASAAFVKYATTAFPIIAKTRWIEATHVPITAFFVLVGVWELTGGLHLLFKPRRAAVLLGFGVLVAELMTHTVPSTYVHPMCGTAPRPFCWVSELAHVLLLSLSVFVYFRGEPLPSLVRRVFGGKSARVTSNPYATRNRSKRD